MLSFQDNFTDKREVQPHNVIGMEGGLSDVVSVSKKASLVDSTVLLNGETGVGKDVIANFIHRYSSRRHGPFVKVNCGAIPESLIDSELFGHEKGSFTGAVNSKKGKFENAEGGTIFLDEIAELSLQAQVRLLRVLQNKEIERVGAGAAKKVDVRVIAATHQNLNELVIEGCFREDLFYRLDVIQIMIPPLRDRRSDIPQFIEYFKEKKTRELGLTNTIEFTPHFFRELCRYDWPGNVRELENTIEKTIATGKEISPPNCHSNLAKVNRLSVTGNQSLTLDNAIARHISHVLEKTEGKISGKDGAAILLDVNPNTLRSKMKKLGIEVKKKVVD